MANFDRELLLDIEDYTGVTTSVVPSANQVRWYNNYDSLDTARVVHIVGDGTTTIAALKKYNSMEDIISAVYPVGASYIQLPGGSTPSALGYPGTWVAQFETEGAFFRTPGGEASAYDSGLQSGALQLHAHDENVGTDNTIANTGLVGSNYRSGISSGSQNLSLTTTTQTNTVSIGDPINGSSGAVSTNANETRPPNRTIRVWLRTA